MESETKQQGFSLQRQYKGSGEADLQMLDDFCNFSIKITHVEAYLSLDFYQNLFLSSLAVTIL